MTRDEISTRIAELLVNDFGARGAIVPGAQLQEDLGLDSLDRVELAMAVEEVFGFEVPDGEWPEDDWSTVLDVVEFVTAHVPQEAVS